MPKEWTDDEVQALIRDSVKIVAEDRERAQYATLHGKYGEKPEDPGDGKTPPPKKEEKDPPKKKSIWWGEVDAD